MTDAEDSEYVEDWSNFSREEAKLSIEDLSKVELAYCPAVSELYDPLLVAADVALRRFNRKR